MCPRSCISMKEGRLGHLMPVIDVKSCIDCGKCADCCPVNFRSPGSRRSGRPPIQFRLPSSAWAAWAKDEAEYITSTSGGAASVLARYIVSQGGAVYGSAVVPSAPDGPPEGFSVSHVRIDDLNGISRLKGSKYVCSSIAGVFPEIKEDVRSGKPTLFIGTPCQVAAVRSMFGQVPENLLLVDIVCHGVPSLSLLRYYVRRYLHIPPSAVTGLSFRNAEGFVMEISGKDVHYSHSPLDGSRTGNLYYNLFMDGFTYRDSCYSCPFAGERRVSDMTVGDFWGLGKDVPEHPYGVSLIMPVTSKGEKLIAVLRDNMYLYRRTVGEAAAGNDQLRAPKHKSLRIRLFRCLEPIFGLRIYYLLTADWILKKRLYRLLDRNRKKDTVK